MHNVKRVYQPGGFYFVTAVTYLRKPILTDNFDLFWAAWRRQKLLAWVLLPDHFHAMLIPVEGNISQVIHRFKITFARAYRDQFGGGRVWQNRYWDHVIRDERDYKQHLDYIHYNPVKHQQAEIPLNYEYSSFHRYLARGYYDQQWAHLRLEPKAEFGE